MMIEDAELLRRYAEDHSEEAFAELVRRHLSLVYFAALRQVGGDGHRANDVAQSVFTDLARKARALMRHGSLTGWLYTSTHFAAAKVVRTEQRRQAREQEAHRMQEITSPSEPPADWERLRPVLDDVMLQLNDRDREAVLLRYFEGRAFADVGERLRLTEDAARMRVDRALDKLRGLLAQRGVSSTSAALGLALATQAGLAAPAGLAGVVTGAALSGAAVTATTIAGGSTGFLTLLAMNKLPIGLTSALAVAGVGGLVVQQQANAQFHNEIAALRLQNQQLSALQDENQQLARTANEVAQLRGDDAELARLRQEIASVQSRLADAARAQSAAAAKRAREEALKSNRATDPASALAGLDRLPSPRSRSQPEYPAALRSAGVEGGVVVSFVVDARGAVRNPVVSSIAAKPSPEFEALKAAGRGDELQAFATAAIDAVSRWQFAPGSKNGRLVNTRMTVPVNFEKGGVARAGNMSATDPDAQHTTNPWF